MRTWWIVRDKHGLRTAEMHSWWNIPRSVGPFWSYTEAMAMLHFWSK